MLEVDESSRLQVAQHRRSVGKRRSSARHIEIISAVPPAC
jgi:hypothetical protein